MSPDFRCWTFERYRAFDDTSASRQRRGSIVKISQMLSFHAGVIKEQIILCAMAGAENSPSFAAHLFNEIASS
jgi:hypothetical protein